MVANHSGTSQGVDPRSLQLRVIRPQCRSESFGGEIAVGGQVEEPMPGRLPAQGFLGGLGTVQLQLLGAAEALAEVAADRGDLVAGGRQTLEVGEKAGPGADGCRPARTAIGARPGVTAVVDVAGQKE